MLTHDARFVAGAVASLLLLAGCTNEVAGSPIGTGQIVDSEPSVTAAPSSSAPAPVPTTPGFPEAADGSDVSACYDGICEVELRAPVDIPVDPATGIASLRLDRVDEINGAQLTGTTTGGGTVSAQLFAGLTGTVAVHMERLSIVALATVDGVAVLRFSPL